MALKGELLDLFSEQECANYLKNSRYVPYKHVMLWVVDTYRIHRNGCDSDDSAAISGGLFEKVCHTSELLKIAETTFHAMALGIQMLAERIFDRT